MTLFSFFFFVLFSSSFFFIHVAVSWIFALCVSTLLSTLKTCHLLSALKNAFDLCVIISIVLERFMKIMTGSRAHWYSNMSSLLVTWTICHFMKPLSIIQSNYNSFWDYAIFTRLFYGLILTSKTAAFFLWYLFYVLLQIKQFHETTITHTHLILVYLEWHYWIIGVNRSTIKYVSEETSVCSLWSYSDALASYIMGDVTPLRPRL